MEKFAKNWCNKVSKSSSITTHTIERSRKQAKEIDLFTIGLTILMEVNDIVLISWLARMVFRYFL